MKITSLLLPVVAVAGVAAPAYADDAQTLDSFLGVCQKVIESQKTCADAAMAVHDAASAAEVAEVFRQEAVALDELRNAAADLVKKLDPALQGEARVRQFEEAFDEAMGGLQMATANLANVDPAYFGCKELEAACQLYLDVLNGMTPAESELLPQVVELYKEFDMIRYTAWQTITSVTDRASADTASAKLAELAGLQDQSIGKLRALLEKLPASKVDVFCENAYVRYNTPGMLPSDFAKVSAAAQDNFRKMGAMEPAFYGSPDLQERAGAFVRMPRSGR